MPVVNATISIRISKHDQWDMRYMTRKNLKKYFITCISNEKKKLWMNIQFRKKLIFIEKCCFLSWNNEYLHTLQDAKKLFKTENLTVEDLVVIHLPYCSPITWPLVRVYPDSDEVVLVVTIRTADSVFKRPTVKVIKLCILLPNSRRKEYLGTTHILSFP